MTTTEATALRFTDDAAAVAGSCGYEADLLDAEAMRDVGFFPTPDAEPPF